MGRIFYRVYNSFKNTIILVNELDNKRGEGFLQLIILQSLMIRKPVTSA